MNAKYRQRSIPSMTKDCTVMYCKMLTSLEQLLEMRESQTRNLMLAVSTIRMPRCRQILHVLPLHFQSRPLPAPSVDEPVADLYALASSQVRSCRNGLSLTCCCVKLVLPISICLSSSVG